MIQINISEKSARNLLQIKAKGIMHNNKNNILFKLNFFTCPSIKCIVFGVFNSKFMMT